VKGIDDDEGGVETLDGGLEEVEVVGQAEGTFRCGRGGGGSSSLDVGEQKDVAGIASGGLQARGDGVAGVVVGGNEQHVALGGR
jgi:hypothetical protein